MSADSCGCDRESNWICERHLSHAKEIRVNWGNCADDPRIYPTERILPPNSMSLKHDFALKDSGERVHFESGMVRDTDFDKTDYSLALDGPMFERLAIHLTKGAKKYSRRNWMRASGQAELDRFKESAIRHFIQWLKDETDEDHCAAVYFNLNGVEYVKERMRQEEPSNTPAMLEILAKLKEDNAT